MNSAIRNFKIKILENKNGVQQLKQTNSISKINNKTNKFLKTKRGPRSPTYQRKFTTIKLIRKVELLSYVN